MKIAILSDSNSSHTQKWAIALASNNLEVSIIGFSDCDIVAYNSFENICVYSLGLDSKISKKNDSAFSKWIYLSSLLNLKRLLKVIKPDIVHAHYATSYGLLGALSSFHPFIISVWGSDVFDFPNKSFIHKALLKFNLQRADLVLSTSRAMAKETTKYSSKKIEITPFGVDTEIFKPSNFKATSTSDFTIGIVKSLEKVYGISFLIKAFALLKTKYVDLNLKLMIVGSGSEEFELKKLAISLGVEAQCTFVGRIQYNQIVDYHLLMDVEVYPSLSESFGVAVLEASACQNPVIVSNVGGLPEVVQNGITGFIVSHKSPDEIANCLSKFIDDRKLVVEMGAAGRTFVLQNYSWKNSVSKMIDIYNRFKIK